MALQKDKRGVDKAWHLTDAGKLPEVPGKARYYQGQVWLQDGVNGTFPLAPQGSGGVGSLTSGVGQVDFGLVGHSAEVQVAAPTILAGSHPLVTIHANGDDAVEMQDWDVQVVSTAPGVGFTVQVSVVDGIAHGITHFNWGF